MSPDPPTSTPATSGLEQELLALAADALRLAGDTLLVTYRFSARAMGNLEACIFPGIKTCETNARELRFSPRFVLDSVAADSPVLARAYLHMVLHCLLCHCFPPEGVDALRWSVASDMAVAAIMDELGGGAIELADPKRDAALEALASQVEHPTASAFYALFSRLDTDEQELAALELLFGMDSHELWFSAAEADSDAVANDGDDGEDTDGAAAKGAAGLASPDASEDATSTQELRKQWEAISRQTLAELTSNKASSPSQTLALSIDALALNPMGLDELLRQLAAPAEYQRINPDEFDYLYYTYGLERYGNMPLVEPIETCEAPELRDFVVALDTSGSIDDVLARSFVALACGMLLGSDALGSKSRVRIMQCDDRVRDEALVGSAEEVEAYLDEMVVRGRGSTDFHPVFDRIEELIAGGEVTELAGVVYFTDGEGTFPNDPAPYDVAFVFVDEIRPVPSWVTPVLVSSDELC